MPIMNGPAPPAPLPRDSAVPGNKQKKLETRNTEPQIPADPNLANPRLLLNGACIYERQLPGDAYITAHVQRLQHGFYSSPAVSDKDYDHVDFLGINFVFHSPNTLAHRFKAATIRASVQGTRHVASSDHYPNGYPPGNPRFLMHAPHLIYGAISPETLQWNYSLTGSLGVVDLPVMASLSPTGGINGRYRRYEMMRIQGSVRTLKSPRGRKFDIEAGEIVWSLEENSLQRSGLPREFTFAMLIQKPRADSRIVFSLDIEPTLQSWYGSYPDWWLSLPKYQPQRRRPVDFRSEVGQRFEPVASKKGFNFATLESSFDDYVSMPGKRLASVIPSDGGVLQDDDDTLQDTNHDRTIVEPIRGVARFAYPNTLAGAAATATSAPASSEPALIARRRTLISDPSALTIHLLMDNQMASHLSSLRGSRPSPKLTTHSDIHGNSAAKQDTADRRESPRALPAATIPEPPQRRTTLRRTRSREGLNRNLNLDHHHPKRRPQVSDRRFN
ncbi:uncharacterized protein NFIA_051010 [Aspergillus fischeri NRRL 181]|uniref:Uncharacterized protein n=1 Tax=Neosartorya fischeri (strain ATCC 1020 / DSM 3700 / CBS 544.65 / FGSC A1164 / JCM 1740 / NRRL 181 / WB 181) TaxID=331117 RepID=A1DLT5_NEOFI|nr:conserved hypothetical protein [Aspergillus fischeri NRRL 181]EAW15756.1 conserved hypothetical protein [Aspergillus fischeri NRRL 181]KAG2026008.1 hypothetical protein GB937_002151 [Aspergillus fischeri]